MEVELTNTASGSHWVLLVRLHYVRNVGTSWIAGGAFLEKLTNQDLLTFLA